MMLDDRIYIFTCTGEIVGNPKGYRTMKGAIIQAHKRGSKAHNQLVQAYNAALALDPDLTLFNRVGHNMNF